MRLPKVIRAEVKFTTNTAVQVSSRELASLRDSAQDAVGLLAVLFDTEPGLVGPLSQVELRRLVDYCTRAGDHELAARIAQWLDKDE